MPKMHRKRGSAAQFFVHFVYPITILYPKIYRHATHDREICKNFQRFHENSCNSHTDAVFGMILDRDNGMENGEWPVPKPGWYRSLPITGRA